MAGLISTMMGDALQDSFSQFALKLVAAEVSTLSERSISRRMAAAHFPAPKTMAAWNWNRPTKINLMLLKNLLRLDFFEEHSNVILLGTTGLGKTHLACALGNAACLEKHHVLFASAMDVVNRLSAAQATHQLAREMKRYQTPRLLVLDALGYLLLDQLGAELLFQIISKRCEAASTIITTNIAYAEWPRIFAGDATLISALLDHLLHHAETIVIEGGSYRGPPGEVETLGGQPAESVGERKRPPRPPEVLHFQTGRIHPRSRRTSQQEAAIR